MSDVGRFLWYAAAGAGLVGLLAGVLAPLVFFGPFSLTSYLLYAGSDFATRATTLVLWALWGVVALAYVGIPMAVTAHRIRRDGTTLHHLVRGGVAVAVVPGLLALLWLSFGYSRGGKQVAVATALIGVAGLLVAGEYVARRRERPPSTAASVTFLNVVVLVVFLAGFAVGGIGAGTTGAVATTEQRHVGSPQIAFVYEYEAAGNGRGVLTVTHDSGDAVRPTRLHLEGDVTSVDGAEQISPGPWEGDATGHRIDGEPSVAPGDSVTVGVESDCVVRVVYRYAGTASTVGKYTCGR